MEHKFIKYDGAEYNATHISSMTLDAFIKEHDKKFFQNQPDKVKEKLTELHGLCRAADPEAAPKKEKGAQV